jgi:hypothetical protein
MGMVVDPKSPGDSECERCTSIQDVRPIFSKKDQIIIKKKVVDVIDYP